MFDKFHFFGDAQPAVSIQRMGKFPEDPTLEQKRAEARRRMIEDFNRPDLLAGGEYDKKHNKILNRPVEG